MSIFDFLLNRQPPTASLAKDRLQVLIAHERTDRDGPEYLPMLKQDIINVIKKYVPIGDDQVNVQLDSQENRDILELNITLPEEIKTKKRAKRTARLTNLAKRTTDRKRVT